MEYVAKFNKPKPYRNKKRGRVVGTITNFRKGQTISGKKLVRGSVINEPQGTTVVMWFETE